MNSCPLNLQLSSKKYKVKDLTMAEYTDIMELWKAVKQRAILDSKITIKQNYAYNSKGNCIASTIRNHTERLRKEAKEWLESNIIYEE